MIKFIKELFKRRKPFNLGKALAGEPVVTRDGREVAGIRIVGFAYNPVSGRVDGKSDIWKLNGRYFHSRKDRLDLFMK